MVLVLNQTLLNRKLAVKYFFMYISNISYTTRGTLDFITRAPQVNRTR